MSRKYRYAYVRAGRLAVCERISGSFSYVSKHEQRTIKDVLKESDDKMYAYKRAHKK